MHRLSKRAESDIDKVFDGKDGQHPWNRDEGSIANREAN
jgi:hypothetical protein